MTELLQRVSILFTLKFFFTNPIWPFTVAVDILLNLIQHLKDKFDHVPLQSQKAIAIQNIAAKKTTPYTQLAHRLMEHIISQASRRRFEQLGFSWEANGG